jgi:hypothetical protein
LSYGRVGRVGAIGAAGVKKKKFTMIKYKELGGETQMSDAFDRLNVVRVMLLNVKALLRLC